MRLFGCSFSKAKKIPINFYKKKKAKKIVFSLSLFCFCFFRTSRMVVLKIKKIFFATLYTKNGAAIVVV